MSKNKKTFVCSLPIVLFYLIKKRLDAKKPVPYPKALGYKNVKYNWSDMIAGTDSYQGVAILMYEIGLPKNADSDYGIGWIGAGNASTSTNRDKSKKAYKNMGFDNPGNFKKYETSGVKSSINNGDPVQVAGNSKIKKYILWIPIYETGHSWVIDGYKQVTIMVKDKATGIKKKKLTLDYVHCNLGWGEYNCNGWYFSGVFDTDNIPEPTRSAKSDNYYRYNIEMLTGIKPE